METQSPAIQRFTAAWQRGDDDAINRITLEVSERSKKSGNDTELVALARVMAANPYGEGK
jgi:hypothetical protein